MPLKYQYKGFTYDSIVSLKVVVIWNSETVPASSVKWPSSPVPINVIQAQHKVNDFTLLQHDYSIL